MSIEYENHRYELKIKTRQMMILQGEIDMLRSEIVALERVIGMLSAADAQKVGKDA